MSDLQTESHQIMSPKQLLSFVLLSDLMKFKTSRLQRSRNNLFYSGFVLVGFFCPVQSDS